MRGPVPARRIEEKSRIAQGMYQGITGRRAARKAAPAARRPWRDRASPEPGAARRPSRSPGQASRVMVSAENDCEVGMTSIALILMRGGSEATQATVSAMSSGPSGWAPA